MVLYDKNGAPFHIAERIKKQENNENRTQIYAVVAVSRLVKFILYYFGLRNPAEPAAASSQPEVTFYLIRHGETIISAEDRAQGWSDAPLTEKGIVSARTLGRGLSSSGIRFHQVYSSNSGRAVNTARNMVETLSLQGIVINENARLRECNSVL